MFLTIARNLLIGAVLALIFCCHIVYWHLIPLGFEETAAYGGLAFAFGVIISVIAFALTTCSLINHGKTPARLFVLLCSVAVLLLFALVAIAGI